MTSRLSPSTRSTVVRGDRARFDRDALHDVLASGLLCHRGVVIDDVPRVLPTTYGYDLDGPDRDGTLYLHGSVAARSLIEAPDQTVCVTISVVDGLVLARSGFHHSMNYRSAVVIGIPRRVTDPAERERALETLSTTWCRGGQRHCVRTPARSSPPPWCWLSRCTRRRSRPGGATRSTTPPTWRSPSGQGCCRCVPESTPR